MGETRGRKVDGTELSSVVRAVEREEKCWTKSGIRKRVEVTKVERKTERTKGLNIEWPSPMAGLGLLRSWEEGETGK